MNKITIIGGGGVRTPLVIHGPAAAQPIMAVWLRGESPEQTLRVANIRGALSTEQYGDIAGFPSRERLLRELETQS